MLCVLIGRGIATRVAVRNVMSDDFETLVAQGKAVYGDVVARSWQLLVAQTDSTDPAAIEATCDLQRRLVLAGAEWLSLCERVLAFADAHPAARAGESALTHQDVASASTPVPATVRARSRTSASGGSQAETDGTPSSVTQDGVARRAPSATAASQQSYRIFPLILDAAPAHVQLVAMSFNGAEWHPIAAWRRIYQQVVQSLQRSDPERFDTLAETVTMSNGRPLFSRDRSVFTAPIDAGGGWFATGQMPTELILQRLRTLVDWWGLPREALSVEVMPEMPAASTPRPGEGQPVAAPVLEPSTGARAEDAASLSEAVPVATLAEVEPPGESVVASTSGETMLATVEASPSDEQPRDATDSVVMENAGTEETPAPARAPVEEVAQAGADTALPDTADLAEESEVALNPDADVEVPAADQTEPVPANGAEVLPSEVFIPDATGMDEPPTDDPVKATEASVAVEHQNGNDPVATSAPRATPQIAVDPPATALAEVPTREALEEEFTPPPVPQSSNVRWVKTINGTRLPLRPAED
jgi:hypothetical protein